MNVELADHFVMDGSSIEVRALTSQIVEAIRGVADGASAHQAAEACVRAAAIVCLVCAKPGRGANVLAKGAGIFSEYSRDLSIIGECVQ